MSESFKYDISFLQDLAKRFDDPRLAGEIEKITGSAELQAVVSQALAANFAASGPGWPPLHPLTSKSRGKVSKKQAAAAEASGIPIHQPLRTREGILYSAVTQVGAPHNVTQVEGMTLRRGTDLIYASLMRRGGVVTPKKAKALWIPISPKAKAQGPTRGGADGLKAGRDFIFTKRVQIPARDYLKIQPAWRKEIDQVVVRQVIQIIANVLGTHKT